MQAVATFRSADKNILEICIVLMYVNNVHSILLTRKNTC